MDFDISQAIELLGKVLTCLLIGFSHMSTFVSEHSDFVTITIPIVSAIFVGIFYRHRTKRKLKICVDLIPNASEFFKRLRKIRESGENKSIGSVIWYVSLINKGYYTVYVGEAGLLQRDGWLGREKRLLISHEYPNGIEIKPGDKQILQKVCRTENMESFPREISGAYAIDKTGKVWRVRKKLKVEE